MSETPSKEDELAGTEQPFVQHLMELRDRLVKAMIAIAIAAAILFFASDDSKAVTGQCLTVDNGATL